MKKVLTYIAFIFSLTAFAQGKFGSSGDLEPTGPFGVVKMENISGGIHVLQDTALLPTYLRDSAAVYQKKDSSLYYWDQGNWRIFDFQHYFKNVDTIKFKANHFIFDGINDNNLILNSDTETPYNSEIRYTLNENNQVAFIRFIKSDSSFVFFNVAKGGSRINIKDTVHILSTKGIKNQIGNKIIWFTKYLGELPMIEVNDHLFLKPGTGKSVQVFGSLIQTNNATLGTALRRWPIIYLDDIDINGNIIDANGLSLTNGQTLISDGTKMNAASIYNRIQVDSAIASNIASGISFSDTLTTIATRFDVSAITSSGITRIELGDTSASIRADIPTNNNELTNGAGYITGYTETDPTYSASQASNITASDITNLSNLSGINTGDQNLQSVISNGSFYEGNKSIEILTTDGISLGAQKNLNFTADEGITINGNFMDANSLFLTNGQTLISDGSQMNATNIETYVRDSVADYITVTTSSMNFGNSIASGGDTVVVYSVPGIQPGDAIQLTPTEAYGSASNLSYLPYDSYYSGVDQVAVRFYNPFSAARTPVDVQFYITIIKAK